jgi:hypothetical protein
VDLHGAEETRDFQSAPLNQALSGGWLEGRIQLIDQRLNYGLQQATGGLENELSKAPLEGQQLLLDRGQL